MPDVAIIGAGVMGLATAYALNRAGVDVVVYERFDRGHARGSSHGRSRIFRLAYAEPDWIRLAQEALAGWRELEARTGERLLELNGLIEVVHDLSQSSAAALDACGVQWLRLEREETERRFPLRLPQGAFAVVQPEAGIVYADRALRAFERGLDVRYNARISAIDELDAACVVVTAGAWVNELIDPPLPVKITRETICYFEPADPRPMPAFVSFGANDAGIVYYALSDPLHGLKAAVHHGGPEANPEHQGDAELPLIEAISAWVAQHIELKSLHPVATDTCLYTTTADEQFILERRGRVVIGSACSGHGFKFAPAIGTRLAALAMDVLR
jgi:sarcosine oxidase